MEKINLSNITSGANVTLTTTTTLRSAPDGKIQADVSVRKSTYGLSGNPKSEEATENYSYTGTPDEVKANIDGASLTADLLTVDVL